MNPANSIEFTTTVMVSSDGCFDNPNFVDESSINRNEVTPDVIPAPGSDPVSVHFENDEVEDHQRELPRWSIVSCNNSIPTLGHFENFLNENGNNYDAASHTPPVTLYRSSIVAANHPPINIEDRPVQ